jgi:RNA-binding protein
MSRTTSDMKKAIKRRLAQGRPTVCVGKGGASAEFLKEIERQLKEEEMVKVRILKSALTNDDPKRIAARIAEQTEASLVEVRGHTFMLYKPDKKSKPL